MPPKLISKQAHPNEAYFPCYAMPPAFRPGVLNPLLGSNATAFDSSDGSGESGGGLSPNDRPSRDDLAFGGVRGRDRAGETITYLSPPKACPARGRGSAPVPVAFKRLPCGIHSKAIGHPSQA